MIRLWISMAGSAGVGKSTLADALSGSLRDHGYAVDPFGEEELFTRSEFASVAEEFRNREHSGPGPFEDAYDAWLKGLPDGCIVIMDWSPAGMAGDLPWALASRSRFVRHLRAVRALANDRVVQLHLKAPVSLIIDRAAEERGEDWLARYDKIARASGHDHPNRLARIAAWTEGHIAATDAEMEAMAGGGWPVHPIDAARSPNEVRDQAMVVVEGCLQDRQSIRGTP